MFKLDIQTQRKKIPWTYDGKFATKLYVKPGVHTNDFAPIHRRRTLKLGHASLATVFRPGRPTFQQIPQENLESPLLR